MRTEEALRELSMHLMQCGALMPIDWVTTHREGSRFMEAFEMAMEALKKEANAARIDICFDMEYLPEGMTDQELVEVVRECAANDLAMMLLKKAEFRVDREGGAVRGSITLGREFAG